MSHFEDVEPILWGGSGGGPVVGLIFLIIGIIAIVWSCNADADSAALCAKFGEKYVDSRSDYTLCEDVNGVVHSR